MDAAIKKAIEGGYTDGEYYFKWERTQYERYSELNRVKLDRLFWQSLGKALGWNDEKTYADEVIDGVGFVYENSSKWAVWLSFWHRFIDHLAEGKDADSFFTNLIK